MKSRYFVACVAVLTAYVMPAPIVAQSRPLPSTLSGVIVFSCATTDAGVKVDEEVYKVDFSKQQVNNRLVEFEITDLELKWAYLPKRVDGRIDIHGQATINRYSGVLTSGIEWNNSKRLTVCRVAGRPKF